MSKHTPGPWSERRWNDDKHIIEVGDSTGWKKDHPGAYIAKIGGWGYAGNGNARLIIAAPVMFDAIKEVLWRMDDRMPKQLREQLEAAISLAEDGE